MQGRRLPDNAYPRDTVEPGDYFFVYDHRTVETDDGGKRQLWFRDPLGDWGRLRSGHTVTEHEDGTVSVDPSIAPNDVTTYHGRLKRGVWS